MGGSEEKVHQFAGAIAFAEGYWDRAGNVLANNIPARFNNPGDLGPGDAPGYRSEFHAGSNVVMFPDVVTGWAALYEKLRRIFEGRSNVYSLDDTIAEMASKYAGDSANWSRNVSAYLAVPETTTLRQWLAT